MGTRECPPACVAESGAVRGGWVDVARGGLAEQSRAFRWIERRTRGKWVSVGADRDTDGAAIAPDSVGGIRALSPPGRRPEVHRERVLSTGMGYTGYVMCEVRFQIPDASVVALGATPDSVGEKLRLLAAMMAFEHDQLSAGAAAELAGISKIEFLHRLKDFGVDALRQSPQDFDRDLETLRDIG